VRPAPSASSTPAPAAEGYATGHLAGALHADLNVGLSAASSLASTRRAGGRHPLPRWPPGALAWAPGDRPRDPRGRLRRRLGGNAACRLWWMLRRVGHQPVAVLDGGLEAALEAGPTLTTAEPPPSPRPRPILRAWQRPTVQLRPWRGW